MTTKRVLKKISTPFEKFNPDGAILMVNMVDPQIATMKVFLEAISEANLPFFVVGNKMDKVKRGKLDEVKKELAVEVIPAAVLKNRGLMVIKRKISQTFKPKDRIAILGVFNSGKTTLISKLIGKKLKTGDLPGTTLEFTPYRYKSWTLIDTVGQIIDISKPMMVSVDLSGCKTIEKKIARVLRQDAEGILATLETAVPQIKKVVKVFKRQIAKGKKVVVTAAGGSSLSAIEMAGQGIETGIPVLLFTNNMAEALPVSFAKGTAEEEMGLSKYIVQAVNPGDVVVGISASVHPDTPILIKRGGNVKLLPIREFVDRFYEKRENEEGTVDIEEENYQTLGVVPVELNYTREKDLKRHLRTRKGFRVRSMGWSKIKGVYRHRVNKIYRIKYYGGEILTTSDHSIFVRCGGGVRAKKVSELRKGDFLVSLPYKRRTLKSRMNKNKVLMVDVWDGKTSKYTKNWTKRLPLKVSLSHELMKILGYYIAEGSLRERVVRFTLGIHEKKLQEDLINSVKKIFKLEPDNIRKKHDPPSAVDIDYNSKVLVGFLRRNCGKGAKNKHIPSFLWQVSKEYFLSFLKAYASGDGYVSKRGQTIIASVSKKLITELNWLCRLHGITSTIYERETEDRIFKHRLIKGGSKYYILEISKTNREWRTKVLSVTKESFRGYVYDLCGCKGEAFFGGMKPIMLHNSGGTGFVYDTLRRARKKGQSLLPLPKT